MTNKAADFSADELSELASEMRTVWHALVHRADHAQRLDGVARQQVWVLVALDHGPRRMSDLAGCAHTSQASLTGIVDRLEERGLVQRLRSEEDRRVVDVAITAEGRAELAEAHRAMLGRLEDVLTPLDAGEQRELLRLMRTIAAHVQDNPAGR